jgi:O-antigen/teichoic acid export membrane protein
MRIKNLIKNKIAQESGMLFFAQLLNVAISGLIFMILRPAFLSPYDIGLISYINSIIITLAHFFNFGLDNTGCRLILNESDQKEKQRIAGMTISIALILSFSFSIVIFLATFFIPSFGDDKIVPLIRLIVPFCAYSILQFFIINICYALGRIRLAALMIISFSILYLPLMILLDKFDIYTVKIALFSEYLIQVIVLLLPMLIVGGKYIKIYKDLWQPIKKENKTVGIKVYFARIIFLPSFEIDKLILGAVRSLESVGFYTLAKMIAGPAIIIGQSIAQSLYRRYADQDSISKRLAIVTLFSVLIVASLMMVLGYFIVDVFMNEQYEPILQLLPLAIVAASINGYLAIFTSFMDAKGMANEVRNVAIVGMVLNIGLNFSLIIPFGMIGGMIARILVLLAMLFMRMHYCNRYTKLTSKAAI